MIRPSTSSRLNPNVIWVRSLVPKLKKSATSAISSARSAARGVSIIVPIVTSRRRRDPLHRLGDGLGDPAPGLDHLVAGHRERDHDLDHRLAARLGPDRAPPRRSARTCMA